MHRDLAVTFIYNFISTICHDGKSINKINVKEEQIVQSTAEHPEQTTGIKQ